MKINIFISFLIGGIVAVNCFRQKRPGHKQPSVVTSSYSAPVVVPYEALKDVSSYSEPEYYSGPGLEEERLSMDELYGLALEEGGRLIVYIDGDNPCQRNRDKKAFEAAFPGMHVQVIVDLSKNHVARLDNQIERGNIIPDVIQLRPSPEFGRWIGEGVLMPYKPIGWNQVYPEFKNPEGYFTGLYIVALSNNINREIFGNDEEFWPTEANDYLIPELKGKIISAYPNDDDATLYMYSLIVDKYGWSWLSNFILNKPAFIRGETNGLTLIRNGTFGATFTAPGVLERSQPEQFILPTADPFVAWAERAAIIKGTKRLAAAKLYMSWMLDVETQSNLPQWSVRNDVPVPNGFRSLFDYPGQVDPIGFDTFVEDRAAVELFREQVTLYVGEVEGPIPTGDLGLDPTRMSVAALACFSNL